MGSRSREKFIASSGGLPIIPYGPGSGVTSLDPSLYAGRIGQDIKYPVVTSLPTIVTDGVSYVVGGVEYLGVSGSWVAQSTVTLGLWISVGNSWVPVGDVPSDLCVIPIIASGTGAGVSALRLTSSVNSVVSIDGIGKFYTDAAGTVGESTSVNISANVASTIYVRLASGTATITVTNCSSITSFGTTYESCWADATNAPFVNKFNLYYTQNAQNIWFYGSNIAITGTTYPWVNATQSIWLYGNNIAITGTTYPWVNVTQSIWFSGDNIAITGTTYPWVNATQNIWLYGNNIAITGTTYPWVNATQNIWLNGNNIAITGTTYPWVNATQSIWFNGNNIAITHPASLTMGTKYNRWFIYPAVSVFTSAMVDRLLIDLAANWTAPTPSSPIVDLRGNCGARTSASDAAVATLQGRGITVSTN